jgi:hypothetical protein
MGCGGSKQEDPKEARKFKNDFPLLRVQKFDEFFQAASNLLGAAEEIRSGLQDSRDDAIDLTVSNALKTFSYAEVIKVLFWAIVANVRGSIKTTKITIIDEAPFIALEIQGLQQETNDLVSAVKTYLKTIVTGPVAIANILKDLEPMVAKGKDLMTSAKDDFKNAGLKPLDTVKALGTLSKNLAKLGKEIAKVKNIPPLIVDAGKDLKSLVPKFKEIFSTCDEVGTKAYQAGVMKPKDIFDKYHPGPKKTAAELDVEKKAAEKAKKKYKKPAPKATPTKSSAPGGNQPNTNPSNSGTNPTNNPTGQPINQQGLPNQSTNNPNGNVINTNPNNTGNPINQNPNNSYNGQMNAPNFGGNVAHQNHTNLSKSGTNYAPGDNSPLGFPSAFNSPMKTSSQAEDCWDEEEVRNPVAIGKIQGSDGLHTSSTKREKFIKNQI